MINQTPIKTNESYKINSFFKEIKLLNEKREFNNIEIDSKNIEKIEGSTSDLCYGLGKEVYVNNIEYNNNKIIINTTGESEILIKCNFDDENDYLNSYIHVNCNHNVNITMIYTSKTKKYNLLNNILKINTLDNVNVKLNYINLLNENSDVLSSIEGIINENANFTCNIVDLGGLNSVTNIYLNDEKDNSVGNINCVYMANNNEIKDINYITHLYGKKSKINMEVQGALEDKAVKNFKGTIDFKSGCEKANGSENENCILLSNTAISKSLPILLCTEENVTGAHSSSSGKIDDEQLYYIMTRGIDEKEATKILINAKFNTILEKIDNEEYIEKIKEEIDRRLN